MRMIKSVMSKKYFVRLLLTISGVIALFLITTLVALSYRMESKVMQIQHQSDQKVLSQIQYNVDYMNEIVKNLAVSTYFDPNTINLMHAASLSMADLSPRVLQLEKIVNGSSFLSAITIYNSNNGCYYSTSTNYNCKDDGLNGALDAYLKNAKHVQPMQFIPMSSSGTQQEKSDLFSYIMIDEGNRPNTPASALILSVKPEWLISNLQNLNPSGNLSESKLLLLDDRDRLLNPDANFVITSEWINTLKEHTVENPSGYFIQKNGKEKYIVSYMTINFNNWTLLSVQPYKALMASARELRNVFIVIISSLLVISVIVSIFIANRLYRPVGKMMNHVFAGMDRSDPTDKSTDELSLVSDQFRKVIGQMEELQQSEHAKKEKIKHFYLRRLLSDSSLISPNEASEAMLEVNLEEHYRLVVFRVDQFHDFSEKTNDFEKRMYSFAIANITKESIEASFKNEIVDMRSDHIAVLVSMSNDRQTLNELIPVIRDIQATIMTYYKVSLTAAISESTSGYRNVTEQYVLTLNHTSLRMVHGHGALITPELAPADLEGKPLELPSDIEKKMMEAIRMNQENVFMDQKHALITFLSGIPYRQIVYFMNKILTALLTTIEEINANGMKQLDLDVLYYYRQLGEIETLEELSRMLDSIFEMLSSQRSSTDKETAAQTILIDTVKEFIELDYPNINLSLQSIAAMMKLSSAHISKMFRRNVQMTIAEYITEVRLKHTLRLLEEHSYTITEVMEKVGFSNHSYFFKLFKKKYGTTPKEYRIKKVVK